MTKRASVGVNGSVIIGGETLQKIGHIATCFENKSPHICICQLYFKRTYACAHACAWEVTN